MDFDRLLMYQLWTAAMRRGRNKIALYPSLPRGATLGSRYAAYFVGIVAIVFIVVTTIPSFTFASESYWQQHVSYDIHVTLIDSIHTLDGSLSVVYTNNSPDTLDEVYFHLYSNAFQPGSLMDERSRAIHSAPVYDRIAKLPESEQGKYW
ncbi:MAG TPA: hypothetical protein VG537_01185, partial [Candidatus Kapabacteria bacterium]|nr:hypothetical protein [Candidatus Kapabacteria bacterium]